MEVMEMQYQKYPWLRKSHEDYNKAVTRHIHSAQGRLSAASTTEVVYKIPVVVHVLHNRTDGLIGGAGNPNITDAQILSQFPVLNHDYRRLNIDTSNTPVPYKAIAADIKIEFCLASRDPNGNPTNGINRVYVPKSSYADTDDAEFKSYSYWPNDQYLNIWVLNMTYSGGVILGYSQFPNNTGLSGLGGYQGPDLTDGVAINYQYFGTTGVVTSHYNKGRTVTHEIGHWLGLFHPWADHEDCTGDDYCNDVPACNGKYFSTIPSCSAPIQCPTSLPVRRMIENYMDYSDDGCMNLFTQDQKQRMRTTMIVSPKRAALLYSGGCCGDASKKAIPFVENFETSNISSNGWKIFNKDSLSTYSKKWTQTTPGGYGLSNHSFYIENDSTYIDTASKYCDYLVTPMLDFSSSNSPVMDFDMAYARNGISASTDSLVISYNLSCSQQFIPFKVFYGNDLITTSRTQQKFIPEDNDWKSTRLSLNAFAGKRFVQFRFEDYSKGVNNLYLDNINIYKTTPDLQVNTYPVPASENLTIEILFTGNMDVTVELFNALGEKVISDENKNKTSYVYNMNIAGLPGGIYIVRILAGGQKTTRKIVIVRG